MNHLLRTLTESQIEPTADLRLLLTSVKEGRKAHEQKLSDAFYDALEGLLADLRMITVDNRDAEAFLKPVSRAEVPDYHDVISQPMDFQTMYKKVKQKAYKSKLEFQDDLNLIWTNCYTYNATENHPLRQCVKRLEQKANRLLQNITDRKDRMDPPLPSNLPASTSLSSYSSSSSIAGIARPRMNGVSGGINGTASGSGYVNGRTGYGYGHGRTASGSLVIGTSRGVVKSFGTRRGVRFEDSPAIVRTPEGMGLFRQLSMDVGEMEGEGGGREVVGEKEAEERGVKEAELRDLLREMAPVMEVEVEVKDEDDDGMSVDSPLGSAGDKRKMNGTGDQKPRKRARLSTQYPTPLIEEKDDFSQLWWGAVQSDALLANGLPAIPFGPSSSKKVKKKKKKVKQQQPVAGPSGSSSTTMGSPVKSSSAGKRPSSSTFTTPTKPKPSTSSSSLTLTPGSPMNVSPTQSQSHSQTLQSQTQTQGSTGTLEKNPKALLTMMNHNIKTMRRVRHTHAKFVALNAASAPAEDEDGEGGGGAHGYLDVGGGSAGLGCAGGSGGLGGGMGGLEDDVVDDRIDEEPWSIERSGMWNRKFGESVVGVGDVKGKGKAGAGAGAGAMAKGKGKKGKGRVTERHVLSGVEMGEANASDCLHWSTSKVLEHVGFQGTSKVALDVFSDICGQYLSNVGRTIRFLSDKFGKTMTPEEIILHTLFESGSAKVQDLERYIKDDIERHGARLGELEKKLVGAYRETAGDRELLEDEGLFDEEEDEEDAGALAFGDFADLLGEDYLGFRELGIAAESGLANLTIPRKLLKGRKFQNKPTALKPTEPPPPYPPPPPFIPLTAEKADEQIGLLRPYYQSRFGALAAKLASSSAGGVKVPALPGPMIPALPGPSVPSLPGPTIPALPGPKIPGTAGASAPNTLPSAPNTLPFAPNTLPSAPNTAATNVSGGSAPASASGGPTNATTTAAATATTATTSVNTTTPPAPPALRPDLVLPDDPPPAAQVKMGPIGQIVKPGGGSGAVKKKVKVQSAATASGSGSGAAGGAAGGSGGGGGSNGAGTGAGGGGGGGLPPSVPPPAIPVPMPTMPMQMPLGVQMGGQMQMGVGMPMGVGVGGMGIMGAGAVSYGMNAVGGRESPVKKVK
ncbi:hypothetical protein CVT24_002811 [Panaeolus cyanescens]|uniref:Bromo domain-containing protein n=1 Tax=Panaeolus cyanescens TaxID=181874 RepID=A0A409YRJ1_9AGAR|nr:hypothetical protein CVT24_002811 [Panaeolus cyanescens]